MPRYYFDFRDGDSLAMDNEGLELLDIADAQMEAASYLADMSSDLSMRSPEATGHVMAIEVRDVKGPLFVVGYTFSRLT